MSKITLDEKFIEKVRHPIIRTWNYVGHDLEQACQEQGESLDNEGAIETCIDADRLWYGMGFKGKELAEAKAADALIGQAIQDHKYTKVLKFLSQHIHLA